MDPSNIISTTTSSMFIFIDADGCPKKHKQ